MKKFGIFFFRFRNFICYALCLLTIVMYDSYWRDTMIRKAYDIGQEEKMVKALSANVEGQRIEIDKMRNDLGKVNDDVRSLQSGNGGKKNKETKRR